MITPASPDDVFSIDKPSVVVVTNNLTCAPCRALKPHLDKAMGAFTDDIDFIEVDIMGEAHMIDIAAELGVTATPTLLYTKDGSEFEPIVSRTTLPLIEEINAFVNP